MKPDNTLDLTEKRILIIDDQRSFQKMLKGMLMSLGARNIAYVDSGEAAINQFNQEKYDIAFIDYNLGGGKNGRQILEELRLKNKLSANSIYMMITGESTRAMVLGAVEVEPDDYLIKPFSQGLLKQRLTKLYRKKHILKPVYDAIDDNDKARAKTTLLTLSETQPRYQQLCIKMLCQLHIKDQEYQQAKSLLEKVNDLKRANWAVIFLAQIAIETGDFQTAIRYCDEVLGQNRFQVDALDIKAKALMKMGQTQESLFVISQSANISPFSFIRQTLMANIALNANNHEKYAQATAHLLDMSLRSIRQNISFVLDHIRALFDAAEHSKDEQSREQYLKQTNDTLKKVKTHESLFEKIAYEDLSTMCQARSQSINGEHLKAKLTLGTILDSLTDAQTTLNNPLLPDSVMTLLAIGEFEQAETQAKQIGSQAGEQNQLTQTLIENKKQQSTERIAQFNKHNELGIEYYTQNKFSQAIFEFEQALQFAPMNTGSALNLLQAILQLLPKNQQDRPLLKEKCEATFKLVDGMTLPEQHKKRLDDIKQQYSKFAQLMND